MKILMNNNNNNNTNIEDQQCNARIREGGTKGVAGLYTQHKQKMLQALWIENVRTRKFTHRAQH